MEHNGIYFNMFGVIYKITNKITPEIYIGRTVRSLRKRFNRHSREKSCVYMHNAMKKYGKENFEISIVMYANNQNELNDREKFCIRIFNTLAPNGYNLTLGGSHRIKSDLPGRILTEKERKKISLSLKNFFNDPENVKKDLLSQKTRKSVLCHQNGIIYPSIRNAAKELGLKSKSKIADVMNGKIKSYKGLTFSYVED